MRNKVLALMSVGSLLCAMAFGTSGTIEPRSTEQETIPLASSEGESKEESRMDDLLNEGYKFNFHATNVTPLADRGMEYTPKISFFCGIVRPKTRFYASGGGNTLYEALISAELDLRGVEKKLKDGLSWEEIDQLTFSPLATLDQVILNKAGEVLKKGEGPGSFGQDEYGITLKMQKGKVCIQRLYPNGSLGARLTEGSTFDDVFRRFAARKHL